MLAVPWALTSPWVRSRLLQQWNAWVLVAIAVDTALLVLVAIWWLWWRLPLRQVRSIQAHDPKDRAEVEDNFRKTVGQALVGAALLIGALVAYLQFSQQQRSALDLLVSTQVQKGFEQLSGKEMVIRLGGIYALEAAMNSSPAYHQPVLEALCAFVSDSTIGINVASPPATDVQAVITVIGRRSEGLGFVDLSRAKIPGANLSSTNLSVL